MGPEKPVCVHSTTYTKENKHTAAFTETGVNATSSEEPTENTNSGTWREQALPVRGPDGDCISLDKAVRGPLANIRSIWQ